MKYEEQERKIYAKYDDKTIRVYQAYNNKIADEAIKLGTFGEHFSLTRMTWIKPSFLWMMYRCGWAEKENQERVLAIDIKREAFDEIVKNSVISSYKPNLGITEDEWKEKVKNSLVRCQWDPERDIYGKPIGRRSIQLGIRGEAVVKYVNEWIVKITDITDEVKRIKQSIDNGTFKESFLPRGVKDNAEEEVERYNQILADHPVDLQILGIGRNGHIGFNEPGTPFDSQTHLVELDQSTIEANARFFDKIEDVPTQAISMGIKNILDAKSIILFAYGESKAEAIAGTVSGPVTENLPASSLQNHPDVTIIADAAALSLLEK